MKSGFSPLDWVLILLVSALADYAVLWVVRHRRLPKAVSRPWKALRRGAAAFRRGRGRWGKGLLLGSGLGLMGWAALSEEKGGGFTDIRFVGATLGWLATLSVLPAPKREAPAPGKVVLRRRQVFLLGLGAALSLVAAAGAGSDIRLPHPVLTLGAWAGSIAALVAAGREETPQTKERPGIRREIWIAAALAGVAFLVRAYCLECVPPMLTGDEGQFGFEALRFLSGKGNNPFRPNVFAYPALFGLTESPFVLLLGRSVQGLRMASPLYAALTVGATYLAGRALFGRRAGLWSGVFLAGMDFHLHFSRLALSNIVDGLSFVLTLGALWYAERSRRPAAFILSGLSAGLGLYFYASARLLPVLIPAWLGVRYLQSRGRRPFPWRGLGLTALSLLVVIMPLLKVTARQPHAYQGSVERASVLGAWLEREQALTGESATRILLRQVEKAAGGFTRLPPAVFYASHTPLLRFPAAMLFLLGLGLLLRAPQDERLSLLGLWLAAIVAAGTLSVSPPSVQRYVAAAPALALLVGYALERIRSLAESICPRRALLFTLLAGLTAAGMAAEGVHFYFAEYAPRSYLGGDHTYLAQQTAEHFLSRRQEGKIVFIGDRNMKFHSIPALPFLVGEERGLTWLHPWGDAANTPPPEGYVLFVVMPSRAGELPRLQRACPDGHPRPVYSPDQRMLGWFYDCPHYHWPFSAPPAPALLE